MRTAATRLFNFNASRIAQHGVRARCSLALHPSGLRDERATVAHSCRCKQFKFTWYSNLIRKELNSISGGCPRINWGYLQGVSPYRCPYFLWVYLLNLKYARITRASSTLDGGLPQQIWLSESAPVLDGCWTVQQQDSPTNTENSPKIKKSAL